MELTDKMARLPRALGCKFVLKGEPIANEKVFSPTGLLPAIMRRANQLSEFCLGYGLGVTFEKVPGAMLDVRVDFDDKVPLSLRMLCVTDVLVELMQASPSPDKVSVDDLMLDA